MQKNNFLNKNIKSGHSRVSLSGIFDARRCSYEIGKTLINKRQLRGRSPITAFGDDGPYVYERQTARVEDPETSSGIPNFIMTNAARGFTLIELLVVVLIIGILAAVALPQYQVAVAKSRFSTLKNLTNGIYQAEQVYFLANNTYTDQFENLDIDMPGGKLNASTDNWYKYNWGHCLLTVTPTDSYIRCKNDKIGMFLQISLNESRSLCVAENTDLNSLQNKICKQETPGVNYIDGTLRVWIY